MRFHGGSPCREDFRRRNINEHGIDIGGLGFGRYRVIEEFANDVFISIHEGTINGVKKRNITQEVFDVLTEEAKKKEMLYAFRESTIKKLSKKYPEAMKELLESEKKNENKD